MAHDATDAQIDSAYRKPMAKFHPDRVGATERAVAEHRARAINAACDRIRKLRRN